MFFFLIFPPLQTTGNMSCTFSKVYRYLLKKGHNFRYDIVFITKTERESWGLPYPLISISFALGIICKLTQTTKVNCLLSHLSEKRLIYKRINNQHQYSLACCNATTATAAAAIQHNTVRHCRNMFMGNPFVCVYWCGRLAGRLAALNDLRGICGWQFGMPVFSG